MAYVATHTEHVHGLKDQFTTWLARLAERRAKYKAYRTTLNELRALSTRDLADLGISPSNIRSIAYQAAYEA